MVGKAKGADNPTALTLYGYRYSVYKRVVALVLAEKRIPHAYVEVDPFGHLPLGYAVIHPFGRVPAIDHDGFRLYETAAITRYLDEAFHGQALQPPDARARARMQQIVSVTDNYGYWPMVRQVYAARVFRAARGEPVDEIAVAEGLERARPVLAALDDLAGEDGWLVSDRLCLADLHLAPMIAAFAAAREGAALLSEFEKLSRWWARMRERDAIRLTEQGLPPLTI